VLWWGARNRNAHSAGLAVVRRSSFALGAAALALVGCGGDDDAGDPYPPGVSRPIAKVRFLAEADRICHSTNARIEAAADDLVAGGGEPRPAEARRVALAIAVPALEAEVRAIGALGAPRGDEREVEAIVAQTERGIEQIRADPARVVNGPPPALRRAGRLAAAYGSEECEVRVR
jgi:hypothetical protein